MSTLRRIADQPTWLLSRANARAQAVLSDAFTAAGVRGYHVRVLAALEQEGPASQADLSRATGIDRSDMVSTVEDLVGWRLADRRPDSTDRRRNVVTLTEAGSARLEELDAVLRDVQDAVLAPLSASERATLVRLLRRLA